MPGRPCEGEQVGHCLVYENTDAQAGKDTKWVDGRDYWWADMVPKQKVRIPHFTNLSHGLPSRPSKKLNSDSKLISERSKKVTR